MNLQKSQRQQGHREMGEGHPGPERAEQWGVSGEAGGRGARQTGDTAGSLRINK